MQDIQRKKPWHTFDCMRIPGESRESEPMHQDDYHAHRAWVTAKRCHESDLEQRSTEKNAAYSASQKAPGYKKRSTMPEYLLRSPFVFPCFDPNKKPATFDDDLP